MLRARAVRVGVLQLRRRAQLRELGKRLDRKVVDLTVGLRGNITGKREPIDKVALGVSALPRLGGVSTSESTYLLRAPRDRAFFVLGHETKFVDDGKGGGVTELIKSFRIDLGPRVGDELLDLDLATVAGDVVRLDLRATGSVRVVSPRVVTLDGAEPAPRRTIRNVVVYLTDTLRADKLRPYRPDTRVRTPSLESWALHAAVFLHGHSQENWRPRETGS